MIAGPSEVKEICCAAEQQRGLESDMSLARFVDKGMPGKPEDPKIVEGTNGKLTGRLGTNEQIYMLLELGSA
jgi:hypothetical protein